MIESLGERLAFLLSNTTVSVKNSNKRKRPNTLKRENTIKENNNNGRITSSTPSRHRYLAQ
jgi:hypothetical protein